MYFEQNMIDIIRGSEPENTSLKITHVGFAGGGASSGFSYISGLLDNVLTLYFPLIIYTITL